MLAAIIHGVMTWTVTTSFKSEHRGALRTYRMSFIYAFVPRTQFEPVAKAIVHWDKSSDHWLRF